MIWPFRKEWEISKVWSREALFSVVVIGVMVGMLTHAFWGDRFPYTHDGENHLARFVNYTVALREGQFPPRFAPYVFSNFGFPVFQYNYPLANILAFPFIVLKLHPERVYAIVQFAFLSTGAVSWLVWLRSRGFEKSAWWGVGQYLLSSYVINLVFFRGNIGEIAVYGLFPSLLVLIDKHISTKRWGVWSWVLTGVLACFFLAHNIFSVFLAPFFLAYHAVARRKPVLSDVLVWGVAGLMTVWFWFPAVFELSLVVLKNDALANQAADHLLGLRQIFNVGTWGFGFSRALPMDSLQSGLGLLATLQVFFLLSWMTATALAREWKRWRTWSPELVLFAVAAGVGIFLSWSGSRWLWIHVPGLSLVQFPWRWLLLAALAGIPWMTMLFARSPRLLKGVFLIAFLFSLRTVAFLQPADTFHREVATYRSFSGTTLTRDENRPVTFTLTTLPSWSPAPEILEGEAQVSVLEWRGSRRTYSVQANSDLLVAEPTVFFPGWVTKADAQSLEQVFTESTGGRVAYRLTSRAEPYQIRSSFSGRTPLRLASELSSLGALMVFVGLGWWAWKKEQK